MSLPTILSLLLLPALCRGADAPWPPEEPAPLDSPLPGDPLKTTVHRLSNGLTVYLSPNPQQPRVAAAIVVRAGSKDDPADSTGMAHYLEHMLFKGTSALGTLDYSKEKFHLERVLALYEKRFHVSDPKERERLDREIDAQNLAAARYEVPGELTKLYGELGVQGFNASTSEDSTVFVCDFPSGRAEAWAAVESERFAHPVFRLFPQELETVYEEKNQSLDNPTQALEEALRKKLYPSHPYGRPVLGTVEHLRNPSLAQMYAFFHRHYVPNNMAIALSGDFDRRGMLELVERRFGDWKPKPLPEPAPRLLVRPRGEVKVEAEGGTTERIEIAWPTVSARHPDAPVLRVAAALLSDSSAGLIDLSLVRTMKVKSAGAAAAPRDEAGEFVVWAAPRAGRTAQEARGLLLGAVGRLKAGGFSEEDVRAAALNLEIRDQEQIESNLSRVFRMASSFAVHEPWVERASARERLRRVTKEDVVRAARAYLGPGRIFAYRRKGAPKRAWLPKPRATRIDIDPARESAFAARVLALPAERKAPGWLVLGRDYAMRELPSGKLYASRNPFDDLFSLTFVFNRGRRQEPDLCEAFKLLELSGAAAMSAEEYRRRLYRLGAGVHYDCDERTSQVRVTGVDANLEPALELARARFEDPSVSSDTLRRFIAAEIEARRDDKENSDYVYYALGQFARRGGQSSVLMDLSESELRGLDLERLRRIIREIFGYRRRTAYVGNRPLAELSRLLGDGRGGFKEPPAGRPLRLWKATRPRLYFLRHNAMQDMVGAYIADETWDPAHVMDYYYYGHYLGGDMGSLIPQEVREARSLAYWARADYTDARFAGDDHEVVAELSCQYDKSFAAVSLLERLLRRPPIDAGRFARTKRAIEEYYRSYRIGFREAPMAMIGWEDQGIAGDPRPRRFEKALKYTLADMEAFSARFKDRPVTFYILGKGDKAEVDALKQLGDFEQKNANQLFPR